MVFLTVGARALAPLSTYGTLFLLLGRLVQPWCDSMHLVLLLVCYAMFGWCPWEACSFWRGDGGGTDLRGREMGGENGGRGRRGNCSLDVIYERIILKKSKDRITIEKPIYMFLETFPRSVQRLCFKGLTLFPFLLVTAWESEGCFHRADAHL